MILPTIRASIGRRDALELVALLGREDQEIRRASEERLRDHGIDALLDDPRLPNALLTGRDVNLAPAVVFYVLVRHALLEGGIDSRAIADYVASMILGFSQAGRAYRISDRAQQEFHYLVDMVAELSGARSQRAFLINAHMGNYSLWMTGLFPDFLDARARRRGAPSIGYYERMGASGFRRAAGSREAARMEMDGLFTEVAGRFSGVRVALNRISDRYLWQGAGDPVNRVLREVAARVG